MENKRNSTAKMRFACAIIFVIFTYVYVAFYQEDVLAVAQHVLSNGLTDYSYTFAPLLVTLVCFLLQVGVFALTGIKRRFHGLTYFPSFLLLALITDVPTNVDVNHSLGAWWFVLPLCLLVWGAGIWTVRQLEPIETEPHSFGFFSRYTWVNLMQMVVMMVIVLFVASNDRLFHERMRMESLMKKKQFDKALLVGENSQETDSSLTMLRIACLNETGELGSRLFTYPLVGGSKAMKPDSVTVKALMWKAPLWMVGPSKWMVKHHLKYKIPVDYELCALLLDKQLDKFVAEVRKHYDIRSPKLPIHYKEALVLYTHRRAHPAIVYHENVMDTDFQDYQQLEHKFTNPMEKQTALHDTYGNTYWYYYDYGQK